MGLRLILSDDTRCAGFVFSIPGQRDFLIEVIVYQVVGFFDSECCCDE